MITKSTKQRTKGKPKKTMVGPLATQIFYCLLCTDTIRDQKKKSELDRFNNVQKYPRRIVE